MTKTAVIPVAGKGVRLGKLGMAIPKALLPYQGQPAIDCIFEMLQAVNIDTAILIVGWKKEGIISYLEDGSSFDMNIAYVIQSEPKGIADAVLRAKPFIKDDNFLVVLGDTLLFPNDALKLLDNANQIMATRVEDPTKHGMLECFEKEAIIKELRRNNPSSYVPSRRDILELNLNKITEKPKQWDLWKNGDLGICGAYRFNHKIFDAIGNIKPNEKSGELELSDAINGLIEQGEVVKVKVFEGTYIDMGRIL